MFNLEIGVFGDAQELRTLLKRRASDAIVCHGAPAPRELAVLRHNGTPFVICRQMPPEHDSYSCSYVDEFHGGFVAGQALVAAGCRKPCHITGALRQVAVCAARWEGFRAAFAGSEPILVDGSLGIQGGADSARSIRERVGRDIDCIFVVNDLTALGVVQTLLFAGVRIPEDVSLIGYDNLPFVQTLPVGLATVDLNYAACYRQATSLLLQSLKTRESFRNRVEPFLVDGSSIHRR